MSLLSSHEMSMNLSGNSVGTIGVESMIMWPSKYSNFKILEIQRGGLMGVR